MLRVDEFLGAGLEQRTQLSAAQLGNDVALFQHTICQNVVRLAEANRSKVPIGISLPEYLQARHQLLLRRSAKYVMRFVNAQRFRGCGNLLATPGARCTRFVLFEEIAQQLPGYDSRRIAMHLRGAGYFSRQLPLPASDLGLCPLPQDALRYMGVYPPLAPAQLDERRRKDMARELGIGHGSLTPIIDAAGYYPVVRLTPDGKEAEYYPAPAFQAVRQALAKSMRHTQLRPPVTPERLQRAAAFGLSFLRPAYSATQPLPAFQRPIAQAVESLPPADCR